MSRRYTYSRTIHSFEGAETFTAEEFDSFDEAKKAVDKGIHDRKLELEAKFPKAGLMGGLGALTPSAKTATNRPVQTPAPENIQGPVDTAPKTEPDEKKE